MTGGTGSLGPHVEVDRPVVHQAAPSALEEITARIGRLCRIAHRMGERRFDHHKRRTPRTLTHRTNRVIQPGVQRCWTRGGSWSNSSTRRNTQNRRRWHQFLAEVLDVFVRVEL